MLNVRRRIPSLGSVGLEIRRFECLADLTDPARFGAVIVRQESLSTVGFSGATHQRVVVELPGGESRRFVLKLCDPSREWTAMRTGDRVGREWQLLAERALDGVWDAFVSPFVAYAVEGGRAELLMEDLGAHAPPDVREPIALAHEDAVLGAMARLHARFWGSPVLSIPWLARASATSELVLPSVLDDHAVAALMPPPLGERLRLGWDVAFEHVSPRAAALLRRPVEFFEDAWATLPHTLVHGDVKVANFAPLPTGGVAAFDWALVGTGPATTDLGWYLGVNASRLARTKEAVMSRYRELLEGALGRALAEPLWSRLEDVAILYGARTMLWAKGAQLADGTARSVAEWEWWAGRLEDVIERW